MLETIKIWAATFLIALPCLAVDEPQQDVRDPLLDSSGPPIWVDEEQLREILAHADDLKGQSETGGPQTLEGAVREAVAKRADWLTYHAEKGSLTPDGCFPIGPSHLEQEDSNYDGPTTVIQLVERADVVLRVKVVSVQQGLVYKQVWARVTVQVLESVDSPAADSSVQERLWFYLPVIDMDLNGHRICRVRMDLETPVVDDELLLLGIMEGQEPHSLVVANYFRVERGQMIEQPYEFIDPDSEVSLSRPAGSRLAVRTE